MGKGYGRVVRALIGGFIGGIVALAAAGIWFVAAMWGWSWFGSPEPGVGQKFFMCVVAPGMFGAATAPVSLCLGGGLRRMGVVMAVVFAGGAGLSVAVGEGGMESGAPVFAAYVGVPALAALVATLREGRGRDAKVALISAALLGVPLYAMFAAFAFDGMESLGAGIAVCFAPWVLFPAVAAAITGADEKSGGRE